MVQRKGKNTLKSKFFWTTVLVLLAFAVLDCVASVSTQDFPELSASIRGGAADTLELDRAGRPVDSHSTYKMESNHPTIVFSDVDGTLVHYPADVEESATEGILKLPPSSTGMKGQISFQTLGRCQDIRRQGAMLVLISGMRYDTLIKRLPYLPKADAYCCEAGGRIFYPVPVEKGSLAVTLMRFDGTQPKDDGPFSLLEDAAWRLEMSRDEAAGRDGFVSNELSPETQESLVSIETRQGALWEFARSLMLNGYVLDTNGYATCFRVNRKQQTAGFEGFAALAGGKVACPATLATSVNLGCVDFYPVASGKRNCCEYLATKFGGGQPGKEVLARHSVCLCDDDNDIEMAQACLHAYTPSISSESMAEMIRVSSDKFTATCDHDTQGTRATDAALALVYARILATPNTAEDEK